jgi:hypothetical protein
VGEGEGDCTRLRFFIPLVVKIGRLVLDWQNSPRRLSGYFPPNVLKPVPPSPTPPALAQRPFRCSSKYQVGAKAGGYLDVLGKTSHLRGVRRFPLRLSDWKFLIR